MASLELAQASLMGDASSMPAGMVMAGNTALSGPLPPVLSFPYGFPQPGDYRIFVQIKRSEQVETGVFDAHVD
jgi:hypothetical protein